MWFPDIKKYINLLIGQRKLFKFKKILTFMPQAVMHVLSAIIAIDLFRDYFIKNKRLIPLHYVFIGGIAGLLPDIDIPLFWLLKNLLGLQVEWFHRTLSHSLVFPLILLLIAILYNQFNRKKAILFGIITFGVFLHMLLDFLFFGYIMPFYPFSVMTMGLNLMTNLNLAAAAPAIDALILLGWLYHEEKKHKISDFI